MKTIKANLSTESLSNLLKELKAYEKRIKENEWELANKVGEFAREDAQKGFDSAIAYVGEQGSMERASGISVNYTKARGGIGKVIATGDEAPFVEFGAGVHFNGSVGTSPHPVGGKLGMTIGSYRPNSLGRFDSWKLPKRMGGERTYGTPTQAPMWNAARVTTQKIPSIAKEVFSK